MSEAELDECVDKRSIRSTCRKVVRVVFKEELADPSIHFAQVLERKDKLASIRGTVKLMDLE